MADDVPVIYVDGILDVQNLGANAGVVYFEYARAGDSGVWVKRASLRIIRPADSFLTPNGALHAWMATQPDPRRQFMQRGLHS